jgi:hypothetical protein
MQCKGKNLLTFLQVRIITVSSFKYPVLLPYYSTNAQIGLVCRMLERIKQRAFFNGGDAGKNEVSGGIKIDK